MPENKFVLLFNTIHDVLRMEKILKQRGISHEVIPVPRALSSDCGMSIMLYTDVDSFIGYLGSIEVVAIYEFDGQEYVPFTIGKLN